MPQKDVFLSMEPAICRLNTNDIERYSDWMEKRLFSYEQDLDGEYEREFQRQTDKACSRIIDPDMYEPADVYDHANDMAIAHCLGIAEVTGYMVGMAISGLYHLWEKQTVRFLNHEMARYKYPKEIGKAEGWNDIKRIFKAHSTDLEDVLVHIYPDLNELRLVINAIKHGYGSSYDRLVKMKADILSDPTGMILDETYVEPEVLVLGGDHTIMKVEMYPQPDHFRRYCNAVLEFWNKQFWLDVGINRYFNGDGLAGKKRK